MIRMADPPRVRRFDHGGGLAWETARFDAMTEQHTPGCAVLFWQQPPCLVLPAHWRKRPGMAAAAAGASAAGWPVLYRSTGGSCVFHGDQVLCVSQITVTPSRRTSIDAVYTAFAGELIATAERLGLPGCRTGTAPDAPCDGRYNLLVGDRKLAGLAMRRRMRGGWTISLVHACLWLSGPVGPALKAVGALERHLGLPGRYRETAIITLAEAVGETGAPDSLAMAWVRAMTSEA